MALSSVLFTCLGEAGRAVQDTCISEESWTAVYGTCQHDVLRTSRMLKSFGHPAVQQAKWMQILAYR